LKTVESVHLYFRESNSDKVYEVDLCETTDGFYLVNFRYGRRGANLREGTKTVFPVEQEEARKVFDKLVLSKTSKGYRHAGEEAAPEPAQSMDVVVDPSQAAAKEDVVLRYLQQIADNTYHRKWKKSRVIWKAGEWRLEAAAPLVLPFVHSASDFEQYSALWTLSRIGYDKAVDAVATRVQVEAIDKKVYRLSLAYLVHFMPTHHPDRRNIELLLIKGLPKAIGEAAARNNIQVLTDEVHDLMLDPPKVDGDWIFNLYLLSKWGRVDRKLVLRLIDKVKMRAGNFYSLRHIYKIAECFWDHAVLAILAKRFGTVESRLATAYRWGYSDGDWTKSYDEIRKPDSRYAYSALTRKHFNNRTQATLLEVGKREPQNFVALAKAILLGVDAEKDNQRKTSETQTNWFWGNGNWSKTDTVTWWPAYASYMPYLWILYARSNRLQANSSRTKWRFVSENEPAANEHELAREEAYPGIWDEHLADVIDILCGAKSIEVAQFAYRVMQANTDCFATITPQQLLHMLSSQFDMVATLGIDVAHRLFTHGTLTRELTMALLLCDNIRGNELGMQWLESHRDEYYKDQQFFIDLLLSGKQDLLIFLQTEFSDRPLDGAVGKISLAQIQELYADQEKFDEDYLVLLTECLDGSTLNTLFDSVTAPEINILVRSGNTGQLLLAAYLMRANKQSTFELAGAVLHEYLDSEHPKMRMVGIKLLQEFPDEELKSRKSLILDYCFSEHEEVRSALQKLLQKMVVIDASFEDALFARLLRSISESEVFPGLHNSNFAMLQQHYKMRLDRLSNDEVNQLIFSDVEAAQILGTEVFEKRFDPAQMKTTDLVVLCNCAVKSIRHSVTKFYDDNVPKAKYELENLMPIVNSPWQDVRQWAFGYFREKLDDSDWNSDRLLLLMDNVREDVQSFSRSLVSQVFNEGMGVELISKLHEHPAPSMQLFATNYLEKYAAGNNALILKMEGFFRTALFGINRGKITKKRVYAFLETESLRDEEMAKMSVKILTDISSTSAIGDQSSCLDLLLTIKEKYPHLEVPVTFVSPKTIAAS
jgi:predicted DNA-binding WGR domain protein